MEQGQEERYVCKLCNKSFLSGRILGGHMRGHIGVKSSGEEEEAKQGKGNVGVQGYGLRENPRKSWKSSGPEFGCKVCGKEFESPRALFGHMRHHSAKEKKGADCKECGKGFRNLRALRTHMRSHPVKVVGISRESGSACSSQNLVFESLHVKRKRSRTTRYKITPNSSVSGLNESSSVNQTEEEEAEEMALCLMMLSRGVVGNFDEFNSVRKSEVKSFRQYEQILENDGRNSPAGNGRDDDESFMIKKSREEKPNSGVSVSIGVILKKKMNEFVDFDEEMVDTEVEEEIFDETFEVRSIEVKSIEGFGSIKSSSCKDYNFDGCDDSQKMNLYRCKTCNKIFHSYHALGGHQTIHRSNKSWTESKTGDSDEKIQPFSSNSTEIGASSMLVKLDSIEDSVQLEIGGSRDTKLHECPICFKVFASGQALGGHKRAHLREKRHEINQEFSDNSGELDLNVPAMFHEEADADLQFRSCWVGNDCKHEPMVGLVAN